MRLFLLCLFILAFDFLCCCSLAFARLVVVVVFGIWCADSGDFKVRTR